ncbi:GNAT family N-acetyltransferase [Corynebacterium propinquum]|uniref:GNAT family N-acetyltransferase n=1 Tax=Corynebacterium propinquum TaxID=43769 RepID=A0AAP4F869_9CORY|nr:GNAT family N-acetyltransferase [Corynebacterium propinquum]MDK4326379.1 GNAT family N-acetyltransferase [Corynebacterium propinquum]
MTDDFIVEQPQESDFDALRGLFVSTLEPHYDGDHDAHLTRLINAHRANGQDANGFNSLAQLGYVARQEPGGRPVGYINLAVKRHGTAKISPLIVDPSARRRGVGEALLNAAPHDVRLLYCTVSEDNLNARTFFFRHGFVQVGTAPDQYRRGKTELILQRPRLCSGVKDDDPFNLVRVQDSAQWRKLTELADSSHVNQPLPAATAVTYGPLRTEPDPVNAKAKTAYVASSPDGRELGGIVLTKKKGGSTKLSTITWADADVLDKLLTGLSRTEEFQETAGRIYVHIPVDPDTTRVFQAHQWRLDALIPGLDDTSQVAAQWSTAPARVVPSVQPPSSVADQKTWSDYHAELQDMISAREWDSFETPQELLISLMAEVGELAEELQWTSKIPTRDLDQHSIGAEMVDVYNYLLRLSWHIDIDLLDAAFQKLMRVKEKYPVNKSRGTTKKYTELR